VVGNARDAGTFSTTVKLYYTAPLDVAGACAYASNYPPVGRYVSAEDIVFTGTSPSAVVVEDAEGYPRTLQSGSTFMVPAGRVVTSFSDKTGAPGKCIPMLGELGFSISPNDVVREQPATFTVAASLQTPASFAITYHWSVPGFGTTAGTGSSFSATAPAVAGAHTVTLTAKAAGHCDKVVSQTVNVPDCTPPAAPTGASANTLCGAGTVTFSVTPPDGCTIDWYTTSSGGSIVPGGTSTVSFSPSINSSTTYYAEARHLTTGCVSATRTPVTATVSTPAAPTGASANSLCGAGTVTFSVTPPDGCTVDWYEAATDDRPVRDGVGVTLFSPSINSSTTYYAEARHMTTGCVSATRTPVTATVDPGLAPDPGQIGTTDPCTPPAAPTGASDNSLCGAGTVTFSVTPPEGCTIDWYDAATGGNPVNGGQGQPSISPAITATTTYYAEARDVTTGCVSATRTPVTATVDPGLAPDPGQIGTAN
jgi:hypothetical protein